MKLCHVVSSLVEHLQVIRATESSWGGILLGNDGEDLQERRQEPSLVHSLPIVNDNLLGPQLTLLLFKLPDSLWTLEYKLTATT